MLIHTTSSWRESLLITPVLTEDNLGFSIVREHLEELQEIQKNAQFYI